jgi:hypothetical protein
VDEQRIWSPQQEAVFGWFRQGNGGNLVVRARAGTGKTTTIIEGIKRAPDQRKLLAAFNKRIATELTQRVGDGAEAKTLHALGFAAVRGFWNVNVANGQARAYDLAERVCGKNAPDQIIKMVAKLHTKAREMVPHASSALELLDVALEFECDPTELAESASGWASYDLEYVCQRGVEAMDLAAVERPRTGIDFADMIFLPLRNHWLRRQYDLVVVDEAQDMSAAQLELALGVVTLEGRVAVVGDDRQAIYGFRGADSGSIDRLKRELEAVELPLTTTYRCGSSIVAEAQRLVPDFNCPEGSPTGEISHLPSAEDLVRQAQPDDFILSRKNAPLAKIAMAFIRERRRIRIEGRDIGQGLRALILKMAPRDINDLSDKLAVWADSEAAKLLKKGLEEQADLVYDKVQTIEVLAEGVVGIAELLARIDELFSDRGHDCVIASTVHKAKGLEADRVFVLRYTLGGFKGKAAPKGDPQEEANIEYVAITRAKKNLVWVEAE